MSWEKVTLPMGEFFRQDGKVVQKFAVKKTIDSTKKILKKNNYSIDDLAYFIGHQANFRMVDFAAKSLEVPEEKHLYNVDRCGNQGAAGASVVLSENWGRFKHDDLVVLTVVGGGLTWSSVLMRYQEDSNK
jgi:3-oxoacyl-[acyl-carrier-protein] synthase-3